MPSMMRGHLLKIMTPLQGRGYAITLAHPEGLYMQIHRRIRRELNTSGKLGEWIEDVASHNPLPHLKLARQKSIKHVHNEPETACSWGLIQPLALIKGSAQVLNE